MSRHRNVRRMNYDEECDGYDEVFGRSVEDDYCISPGSAQFLYDRNASRQQSSAAFMSDDDIPEEGELEGNDAAPAKSRTERQDSLDYVRPELNPIDEARLRSCLDEIHNIVGDSIPEHILVATVLDTKFDLEKALDQILSGAATSSQSSGSVAALPPRSERKNDRTQVAGRHVVNITTSGNAPLITAATDSAKAEKADPKVVSIADGITKLRLPLSRPVVTGFNPQESADDEAVQLPRSSRVSPDLSTADKAGNVSSLDLDGGSAKEPSAKSTPSRVAREPKVDARLEYERQRGGGKDLLNLVVIGHVDAGKSTLMGHLLCLVGAVSQKTMHKHEQEAKKIGKASFMYAWVLDETGEERSRGVTMDVGYSRFETPRKTITLLDAPGHRDFIPNMITGASQADVAMLVVDATRGEFETGFEAGGQTREHALLVRSLGVSQLIVAVNKLDTVAWSQERYQSIVKTLGQFLRQAGFKEADLSYIPCSGLTGENLTSAPVDDAFRQWYSGPSLLQQIDQFQAPERPVSKPFRLCVSDVFRGQGSTFSVAGKVETGMVTAGDRVLVVPLGETGTVKSIALDDASTGSAFAGDQVVLAVAGIDQASVMVGCIVCDPAQPVAVSARFRARIVVFNIEMPITKGFQAVLHYQSLCEPVIIKRLVSQLHKSTGEALKKRPRCLTKHSNAVVELEVSRPICIEMYKDIKELGRFMLRCGGSTVAAGLVTEIL